MRGLLTLLLYAAFFYLMMRFGCGAHMVHGHGGHGYERHGHGPGSPDEAAAKDPVCGMTLEQGQGYTTNYQGRVWHFCSRKCLDSFEAEPQRYGA